MPQESTIEDLAAPVATPAQQAPPAEPRSGQEPPPQPRPAREGENLSEADLKAVVASSRRARRNPSPAKQDTTGAQPDAAAQPERSDVSSALGDTQPAAGGESNKTSASTNAEAEPGSDPDPEDLDDVVENAESLTDEQVAAIKDKAIRRLVKRVRKLTAQRADLQRKVETVPAQEAPVERAPAGDPEVEKIDSQIATYVAALRWARNNPDGGEFRSDDGAMVGTYTADQVQRILDHGPAQISGLQARREVHLARSREAAARQTESAMVEARKAYPWLGDKASEEYRMASDVLHHAPYLRQHPEWPTWIADAIAGRMARLARAAAPAPAPKPSAAVRPVPPMVPPAAGATAPRGDPMVRELAEAEAEFDQSGSPNALKRVQILRRQLSRKQAA